MQTLKYSTEIDMQKIDDQIVTALEGGSNYWYYIKEKNVKTPDNFVRNENIHYEFLDKIYQGSTMEVCDKEDGAKLGELNLTTIQSGLEKMQHEYKNHFADLIDETGDATTADVFFQLCIMNEITFG